MLSLLIQYFKAQRSVFSFLSVSFAECERQNEKPTSRLKHWQKCLALLNGSKDRFF